MATEYPAETLGDEQDDGTMVESLAALARAVVGRKIVNATIPSSAAHGDLLILLDNGTVASLVGGHDCCAFTEVSDFLLHPEKVDHVIMGVGTTDEYQTWHIYADAGDVLELQVGWSCGNPFYYGYGFSINVMVETPETQEQADALLASLGPPETMEQADRILGAWRF